MQFQEAKKKTVESRYIYGLFFLMAPGCTLETKQVDRQCRTPCVVMLCQDALGYSIDLALHTDMYLLPQRWCKHKPHHNNGIPTWCWPLLPTQQILPYCKVLF